MRKLNFLFIILLILVAGCRKDPFQLAKDPAINATGLRLLQPFSGTAISINPALANTPVIVKWSSASSKTGATITYRWVAVGKTAGGNIDAPALSIPADANGTATQLSLTYGSIKAAMEKAGFPIPQTDVYPFDMLWSVVAEDGKNATRSQDVFTLSIVYNRDGVTPFSIINPASSTTVNNISPSSTTDSLFFNWQKSSSARPTVNPTKYTILFTEEKFDAGGNVIAPDFTNIKFTLPSNNSSLDTFRRISYKDFSAALVAAGYTDVSQINKLRWTVKAVSGLFTLTASNSNSFYVVREIKLYMPGGYQASQGLGNNWDPPTAPELIRDVRNGAVNTLYWTYAFLNAGEEFKITQGRAWDTNWGFSNNTVMGTGDLVANGNNFVAPVTGVYRISVDRVNLKYDIRPGRMGFVGGAVPGNNWSPATTFTDPNSQMTYIGRDKFMGMNDFIGGQEWKMIDNNDWNGGAVDIYNNKSYSGGASGSVMQINAGNFPAFGADGFRRVIWDGSDKNNIKYFVYSDLRIVGAFQGWDASTAPSMDYQGNGVWKKTINLPAGEFKFVSAEGWDFNYGGSAGTISRDGSNLSVGVSGSYTITVDERNKTYTIL
ncbi:MAG: SusF/SusE family outer membrane protein [Sphingobacteriales bacterium]|nr:SusF/SusE family outer membrane protein [Sphingobacteriales bacterium]